MQWIKAIFGVLLVLVGVNSYAQDRFAIFPGHEKNKFYIDVLVHPEKNAYKRACTVTAEQLKKLREYDQSLIKATERMMELETSGDRITPQPNSVGVSTSEGNLLEHAIFYYLSEMKRNCYSAASDILKIPNRNEYLIVEKGVKEYKQYRLCSYSRVEKGYPILVDHASLKIQKNKFLGMTWEIDEKTQAECVRFIDDGFVYFDPSMDRALNHDDKLYYTFGVGEVALEIAAAFAGFGVAYKILTHLRMLAMYSRMFVETKNLTSGILLTLTKGADPSTLGILSHALQYGLKGQRSLKHILGTEAALMVLAGPAAEAGHKAMDEIIHGSKKVFAIWDGHVTYPAQSFNEFYQKADRKPFEMTNQKLLSKRYWDECRTDTCLSVLEGTDMDYFTGIYKLSEKSDIFVFAEKLRWMIQSGLKNGFIKVNSATNDILSNHQDVTLFHIPNTNCRGCKELNFTAL